MALTFWKNSTEGGYQTGNYNPENLYYEEDRSIVLGQARAETAGLLHFFFRGEPVTVFGAKDRDGTVLPKVALPCPPYYHDDIPEAIPGNVLTELDE